MYLTSATMKSLATMKSDIKVNESDKTEEYKQFWSRN